MRFEIEVGEIELNLAAAGHGDRPEALGVVTVRQRIVWGDETTGHARQLTATTCSIFTDTQRPIQTGQAVGAAAPLLASKFSSKSPFSVLKGMQFTV